MLIKKFVCWWGLDGESLCCVMGVLDNIGLEGFTILLLLEFVIFVSDGFDDKDMFLYGVLFVFILVLELKLLVW